MTVVYIAPLCRPRPPVVIASTMLALLLRSNASSADVESWLWSLIEYTVARAIGCELRPEAWS